MGARVGRGGPGIWAALPTHRFVPVPGFISPQVPTSVALFPNFGKLSQKPSLSSNLLTNPRTLWNLQEASPPCPLPAVPAPHCPLHTQILCPPGQGCGRGLGRGHSANERAFFFHSWENSCHQSKTGHSVPTAPSAAGFHSQDPTNPHLTFLSSPAWLPPGLWNRNR